MRKSNNPIDEEFLMKKFKEYEGNPTIALRNEIIEINVPLVEFAVTKYLSDIDIDKDELISIGYFGLIKAVESYDMDYGTKFSTYATTCILNQIKKELSTVTDIRIVRYNYPILKAKNTIEKTTGIKLENYISELDSILEENIYVSDEMKKKLKDYLLNRDCKYNEHNVTGAYEIAESINTKIMLSILRSCLLKLTKRERKVLEFKYGFYGFIPTGTDLGDYMECTR